MSKENKLLKRAKQSMKILKSGKIMVKGDQEIDLSPFIKQSSDEAVVSRLNGIISKEDVVVEEGAKTVDIKYTLQSLMKTTELESHVHDDAEPPTIVIPIKKKSAISAFDFLTDGPLGDLLRSSSFALTYKKIKHQWVELNNDDTSSFTNVMYVPNIVVFMDVKNSKFRKDPYKVNVLILALPTKAQMIDDEHPNVTNEDASFWTVADILESAIRVGSKKIILDPFEPKVLRKDKAATIDAWSKALESDKIRSQFNSINFIFEDEDRYVSFRAKVKE